MKENSIKKSLVLLSGGVDSATCLAVAVKEYGSENVLTLCISYGQKHDRELSSAKALAEYYVTKLIQIDLTDVFAGSECSLLKESGREIPQGAYDTGQKIPQTYVPFRNGLFLSVAASTALSHGCSVIYYGAHKTDADAAYPDCSETFNAAISEAVYEGSGRQLKVSAPFITLTKRELVQKGLALDVPYGLTWSCYEGGEIPCGKCATCIEREKAFT
ncbi:MAG: 7-cyano-7-deazaguanine synthase QueC [Oscillospiraceae bacterium]|jgi:7-cyano-7-deazaguanine synthase|nr:7-cyano-7-deazaguanine synthase QueC [Oscillospiraceae bacterium]